MCIGIQSNRNVNADYNEIDYGYNGYNGSKWHLGKSEEYGIKWGAGDVRASGLQRQIFIGVRCKQTVSKV